ncbi:MAG: hypothetical protein CME06_04220 [Gemmatimonadetes bacterium]|nr:hypothetical protein [Gemmatimonadota bacterium]
MYLSLSAQPLRSASPLSLSAQPLRSALALIAVLGVSPGVDAAQLVVDPNCTGPPPCYTTIQSAVNDATHGDEVFVLSGTYTEQIWIAPPATNPPEFTLTLRAEQSGAAPVTVRYDETNQDEDHRGAVVEIFNDSDFAGRPQTKCNDMRVTIEGFEIFGLGEAAAISMRNQSLKWGAITNNEIVAMGTEETTDGMTIHHFVGKIANNRVSGNSEGIHVGYARLDWRHVEPGAPPEVPLLFDTIVEHNLFYCNPDQHGIHFVHSSKGIVRNNIVVRNINADPNQFGRGIVVGEPPVYDPSDDICVADPDECYDKAATGDDEFIVEALVHNNTIQLTDGSGLLIHPEAAVKIRSNVIRWTGREGSRAAIGIHPAGQTWPGPDAPDLWDSEFNMLDGNQLDYEHPSLEGDGDLNKVTGNNSAAFQGLIDPPTASVSFMLRIDDESSPCYPEQDNVRSDAIDVGWDDTNYWDALGGPGLGLRRNDMGAYGGPHSFWDPNEVEPCVEYLQGVGQCWSSPDPQ